jgi:hypothetical protein
MKCIKIESLIDYIDNELKPEIKIEVEEHLKSCPSCQKELKNLQNTIAEVTPTLAPSHSEKFWHEYRHQIREKILKEEPKEKPSIFNMKLLWRVITYAMAGTFCLLISLNIYKNSLNIQPVSIANNYPSKDLSYDYILTNENEDLLLALNYFPEVNNNGIELWEELSLEEEYYDEEYIEEMLL